MQPCCNQVAAQWAYKRKSEQYVFSNTAANLNLFSPVSYCLVHESSLYPRILNWGKVSFGGNWTALVSCHLKTKLFMSYATAKKIRTMTLRCHSKIRYNLRPCKQDRQTRSDSFKLLCA